MRVTGRRGSGRLRRRPRHLACARGARDRRREPDLQRRRRPAGDAGAGSRLRSGACLRRRRGRRPRTPADADLEAMDREALLAAARAMRAAIRTHRDASGHDLCWHHPELWALLPDPPKGGQVVPDWPHVHGAAASGTGRRSTGSSRRRRGRTGSTGNEAGHGEPDRSGGGGGPGARGGGGARGAVPVRFGRAGGVWVLDAASGALELVPAVTARAGRS